MLAELWAGGALRKLGHVVGLVCLIAESDAGEGVAGEVFQPVAVRSGGVW